MTHEFALKARAAAAAPYLFRSPACTWSAWTRS